MSSLKEEGLIKILPKDGPTVEEVNKYLEKYNDEFIIIKCGGSVLVDPKSVSYTHLTLPTSDLV